MGKSARRSQDAPGFFVPLFRNISMDNFDKKIRAFLVEQGYLFPVTDSEIEKALKEVDCNHVIIPPHLDDPAFYLHTSTVISSPAKNARSTALYRRR